MHEKKCMYTNLYTELHIESVDWLVFQSCFKSNDPSFEINHIKPLMHDFKNYLMFINGNFH